MSTLRLLWGAAGIALMLPLTAQAGYQEGMEALAVRDYVRARNEFEQDRGEAKSLFELSKLARYGLGEPANESRSTNLLRQASEMGHAQASMHYAFALGNGRGVEKDGAEGARILARLAEQGNTAAQVDYGRLLRYGWWGNAKDEARAAGYFLKAMEAGNDDGLLQYAVMLMEGVSMAKNEARGAELLRAAADRGHEDSQIQYAWLLVSGTGVPRDEVAGTMLYRKVADASADSRAQFSVGVSYQLGRGVYRDEKMAVRWIDAAARQGHAAAQLRLAGMYRDGIGVPRVRSQAYFWYAVAARNTNASLAETANRARSELARDMNPTDLQRQTGRADAFRPQPGFRPRINALPPLARGETIALGSVNLKVPSVKGFANAWEQVEWVQQAYPNDPDEKPLLMVMQSQEDTDRSRLGLPVTSMRRIEFARQFADDAVSVTPALFADLKLQLRGHLERGQAANRFQTEGMIQDDDRGLSFLRMGVAEGNRIDAMAFLLVKERVLALTFSGYTLAQKAELDALVRQVTSEIMSANRGGFFSN